MTIQEIEKIVCRLRNVSYSALHTKNRVRILSETRQIIIFFALELGMSEVESSDYYGLDHSTAHHAKIKIKNIYDTDKDFAKLIDECRFLLTKPEVEDIINKIETLEHRLLILKYNYNKLANIINK